MDKASEAIYALKPVTFATTSSTDKRRHCLWSDRGGSSKSESGLVGRNREGKPESVRYEQINAMLLNEFLKEHRKNEEQRS